MVLSFERRGFLIRQLCCAFAVWACQAEFSRAAAPDNPRKFAITDISKVDADFQTQGEYSGTTSQGRFGLQVVALGDGQFQGMLYDGGLPGNGWNRTDRVQLESLANTEPGQPPVLRGEEYLVELRSLAADLSTSNGIRLGTLQKVRRTSRTLGLLPPASADVLFDDSADLSGFENAKLNNEGLLDIGALIKKPVGDFRLHLEFRTPYMPYARGQARGNSGVYIQRRYEVQVLDSFGLTGEPNECGGLYRQKSADLNMCFPPLSWQTYDIYFTAARFDESGKNKIAPAVITVRHNGVVIHDRYELKNKTGAGRPEGPEPMQILLQDHGNPVAFRNIWLVHSDLNHGRPVVTEAAPTPASTPTYRVRRRWRILRWLFGRRR